MIESQLFQCVHVLQKIRAGREFGRRGDRCVRVACGGESSLDLPHERGLRRPRRCGVTQVMLGFESRFWPEELFDVVCTDSYLPEIWTLKPEGFRDQRGEPNYLITGFVAGDAADKVCVCERARATG
jgi:hypothetical protein